MTSAGMVPHGTTERLGIDPDPVDAERVARAMAAGAFAGGCHPFAARRP
ncbi:MAG: hypothetical protein JJE50_10675 [Actinomycetales bacterium]|nr:hypothetical protein [Actinomycetales bacterium]